jgi:tetratricopeptide (TPR) repeat protein
MLFPFPSYSFMKPHSSSPSDESSPLFPKIVVAAICVSSVFSVTWLLRKSEMPKPIATTIEQAKPVSSLHILDQLPPADLNSTVGKALNAAILKTRELPDKAENWVAVGDLLAQLQRDSGKMSYYDFAESIYQEALRLRPELSSALTGMAWVTGGRHDFDESVKWANRALAIDAGCVEAYGIIGDAEVELGEYEAALDHYQKMMDLRPDLSSWSRGAHLLWLMGDKSKAQWLMGKAINAGAPFAENTAWCRAKLASMLFHDGALLPAETIIQPLVDAKSKNVHFLLVAAKIAAAKQDFSKAIEHYQMILSTGSHHEALAGIGDILLLQGKKDEAETYYQKIDISHSHDHSEEHHDHHFVAKFLADHDRDLDTALHLVEDEGPSKNVHAADTMAWVYYKNGKLPEAIAAMKTALKYNTPDAEIRYHAGIIAAAQGDLTSATKHLQAALQMNPNFSITQIPALEKALQDVEQKKSITRTEPHSH